MIANKRKFLRSVNGPSENAESISSRDRQSDRARTCALSSEKLSDHVVACELGNIMNKEILINMLMNKSLPDEFNHIRGLRDVKDVKFTTNPEYAADSSSSPFICPITRMEFNGLQPFVIIWTTGYVLSEKSIREMGNQSLQAEYGPFTDEDIVRLLPSDDEQVDIMKTLTEKRQKIKNDKKVKKRSIEDVESNAVPSKISSAVIPLSKKLLQAESIVSAAAKSVQLHAANSGVYKNLFHKDKEADKHDRDLFMSVAGIRYTLK